MTTDVKIDDVAQAIQLLAEAVGELAFMLTGDPATRDQAVAARRIASGAERLTERVLLGV